MTTLQPGRAQNAAFPCFADEDAEATGDSAWKSPSVYTISIALPQTHEGKRSHNCDIKDG